MAKTLIQSILEGKQKKRKFFAVLIDPDTVTPTSLIKTARVCNKAGVDFILVGGSLITNGKFEETLTVLKKETKIPLIIFPGNMLQVSPKADGILLLSLISGRNPDLLIGKHVISAPVIRQSGLEVLPTGYMLIDGGRITSVSYMSHTTPIPADKEHIAMSTALAGQQLGLQLIYMDAGSGAIRPVSASMIKTVKQNISIPLIIGGGIKTAKSAIEACNAGADMVVIGNAAEKKLELIAEIAKAIHRL